MKTLAVWTFPTVHGAELATGRLGALARGNQIAIDDAACVSWLGTRRQPDVEELGALTGPGVLWRGFWWMLLGLIVVTPKAGVSFGGGGAALAGSLGDVGLGAAFIKRIRADVKPGASALFVLADAEVVDSSAGELGDLAANLLRANLDETDARRLHEVFAEEPPAAR
jgi:uncharacterized membrane protein